MFPSRRSTLALFVGAALAVSTWPVHAAEKIKAVASFSILGDLVRQVGGDRVEVTALVGPNGDAHVFSPSPADAMKVKAAQVVFVNGLGLEGWMDRFFKASGSTAPMIVASTGVKPIEGAEVSHDTHAGHSGEHRLDPHAWQNVANVKLYVANIRDALVQADPGVKETYEGNAARYLSTLDALDAEVKAAIAKIPADRRRIITTHDALGYFAAAYGIQVVAPQGVSTEAEASAGDVARIIRQIKAQKIPAVFIENISDDRLMQRIAKETGARIGDKIYSDALSPPDGPAGTYVDMIRNNVRAFSTALMG
ncbi:metal ABC transporter substrate-binding protein [Microvirga sp. M2]|uniref:metal ABC transporter substrate-binding protein n=1 Tax=Microvirga sp. M2 TaxID=3073270 RepID=UPI0039C1BA84